MRLFPPPRQLLPKVGRHILVQGDSTRIRFCPTASLVLTCPPFFHPRRKSSAHGHSPAINAEELATIAAGWALLHEVRHLQQQEGTSADPFKADPTRRRAEELSCDDFATRFLLMDVESYARREGVEADLVRHK
jgi:hypothetical protein